jgi:hypothetical protein
MGLMKISTYFKSRGDNVRFYKGDLQYFAATLLCEDLVRLLFGIAPEMKWRRYIPTFIQYIRYGKKAHLPEEDIRKNEFTSEDADMIIDQIIEHRAKFKNTDFFKNPRFDIVGITTLFTFEWAITIETINFVKQLCKDQANVYIGGIASSIIPQEIEKETGIVPIEGILDYPGVFDEDSEIIIDALPLDYSILEEIDYKYPTSDAYFAYMTRGCPNKCRFCAVPRLEPKYQNYVPLREQLKKAQERFGEQRNLMLMDNNVLASTCFEAIIDEIASCGFGRGATYIPPNPYSIAYKNLVDGYNDRAYIRVMVSLLDNLLSKCSNRTICKDTDIRDDLYKRIMEAECDQIHTATKEALLGLHDFIEPLYRKYAYRPIKRQRIVDFNQGIDGRIISPENMKKLSEINIRPVRIAFDNWKAHEIYEHAVISAASAGLTDLSNYILYNFDEEPVDLYRRMKLSVDLCEEHRVNIYSFPMKYHPIDDPKWFRNRDFVGKKWNKKYIRAVQAVLTSTHGKIGRGKQFFEAAFGVDEDEFHEILMMPEALIIRRFEHDEAKRRRYGKTADYASACDNITDKWREIYHNLTDEQRKIVVPIIHRNVFDEESINVIDDIIRELLRYYRIPRPDH